MSNKCPYCGAPGGSAVSCGSCQHHLRNSSINSGQSNSNSGGGGCFPAGTKIQTPYGSQDIASIRENDLVSSINAETGELEAKRVLKILSHSKRNIWKICFNDSKEIRTTSNHSFRTLIGWKIASRINLGEEIYCYEPNGKYQLKAVSDSSATDKSEDVFNIYVESNYNFIVEGALVHSFSRFRWLRVFLGRFFNRHISAVGSKNSPAT